MVSPSVLLGIGVGVALGLIGLYLLWLETRLAALEAPRAPPGSNDEDEPREPPETGL